jgi:hypothetical protein
MIATTVCVDPGIKDFVISGPWPGVEPILPGLAALKVGNKTMIAMPTIARKTRKVTVLRRALIVIINRLYQRKMIPDQGNSVNLTG